MIQQALLSSPSNGTPCLSTKVALPTMYKIERPYQ